ncbi:RluA family pseudouridine synthase [Pleionea sp. CnH1-48]|uniref:RluA family pseudouridine synthase n=1 Tax=Pleionea sp. CnH1-48 TaxID=2954494 RepID=UPI00209735D2|nr:RNA pseudouridine synthase [Pleionea sp. CnH1-48]MCO7224794.1 RNA pseudouridine synthase [Pleionea sp. CnH1-48]
MTSPAPRFELHLLVEENNIKAIELLKTHTSLSKQKLKQAMAKGCVWLTKGKTTQRLRRATKELRAGQTLHIYYDDSVLEREPPEPTLIADERDYSVWYKPSGMLSQGSKWGDHCTISRWAEQKLQPQRVSFVVHRLDRAASGLIMLAHTKTAAAKLSNLFQQRKIRKVYRAIVEAELDQNTPSMTLDEAIDDKPAVSHVALKEKSATPALSLVEIDIETGRKHQIRRHLSSAGYPIAGDRLYGHEARPFDLQLTACQLAFECPIHNKQRHYQLDIEQMPSLDKIINEITEAKKRG